MALIDKLVHRHYKIAYFSMEIGLLNIIPTYSGGLGVLAGDTIKSSADLGLPLVGVTLLSKKGYFQQEITPDGKQIAHPVDWPVSDFMILCQSVHHNTGRTDKTVRVKIKIEGREIFIQAWRYLVKSIRGGVVPVFFLDTDLEENDPEDRELASVLYGGDRTYRLKQEMILGIGGVRILEHLGFTIQKYHMNEGHASLLALELLNKYKRDIEQVWDERSVWDIEAVKELCVFTTHTPVEAGHDQFPYNLVQRVLGEIIPLDVLKTLGGEDHLNMTLLALNLSKYVNGVAKKHGEVSKNLFPGYEIHSITNGVHSYTWTCESFKRLYHQYLPGWANEPELFVRVDHIPDEEIWNAHIEAKEQLIKYVHKEKKVNMNLNTLTIGFARRSAAYKRADLLFFDVERLSKIGEDNKIQIIYAGKAHPKDEAGKKLIEQIYGYINQLKESLQIVYLENYDMDLALRVISGVDIWLNTPLRPLEASGTSGMKAAHNGVPNFSVLDGWWIEGHIEEVTGWSIGPNPTETNLAADSDPEDAEDLYHKLESLIIPTFYNRRSEWIKVMKNAIGKNAYYFNTHRMMRRYVTEAYLA